MDAEKINELLRGAGVEFERESEKIWNLKPGPGRSIEATLVCIPDAVRRGGDLLKLHTPVAGLPPDAGVDFFKQIFRKNRDMGHGAFAMQDDETVCFVDTLELDHCDQNEMDATLDWLMKAKDRFNEKLDPSKMPYLET